MLHNTRECLDTAARLTDRQQQSGEAVHGFYSEIGELLEAGEINPRHIALSDLFEAFVPDGRELLDTMRPGYKASSTVFQEAADSVNTGAFSNIIGQITYSSVLQALDSPDFIAMSLVTTDPATTQGPEILPGIGMIGDRASDVGEGENYPRVALNEEYVEIPRKVKDGFILPITEEAIWEDKTGGLLMTRANAATESMGITIEKEGLDVIFGITNSYKRNGTATDTYLTSGAYTNSASNTFLDYTDIDVAMLLFDDITDPNTGEPVLLNGQMQIVVPTALDMAVARALNATEVRQGTVSGTVPLTVSGNPLQGYRRTFEKVTSQYVKNRTSSAAKWYIGDFKNAFGYREVWPVGVFRMDRNSSEGFATDVVTQIKVRRKGAFYVREPRKVVEST